MKNLFLFLLIILALLTSCKKEKVQQVNSKWDSWPQSIGFVVIDSTGQNLINSINDDVSVVYYNQDSLKVAVPTGLHKLRVNSADTVATAKYGGLAIGSELSKLSAGDINVVNDFELFINHEFIGKIYFDYKHEVEQGHYLHLFKFNGEIVEPDSTVGPPVYVLKIK